jgi:hypothetical protein
MLTRSRESRFGASTLQPATSAPMVVIGLVEQMKATRYARGYIRKTGLIQVSTPPTGGLSLWIMR